jgi:hypothetical protein
MFRLPFGNPTRAGSGRAERSACRFVTRATGLAAVTVLAVGAVSGPVTAQIVRDHRGGNGGGGGVVVTPGGGNGGVRQPTGNPAGSPAPAPLQMLFSALHCLDETNDGTLFSNSDEPYALIYTLSVADRYSPCFLSISQVFSDVDAGETKNAAQQFLSGPLESDRFRVILVALMESDNSDEHKRIYSKVSTTLRANSVRYKQSGLVARESIASALASDIERAIQASQIYDDQIGRVQELVWGEYAFNAARAGSVVNKRLTFGDSGSKYELRFQLQPLK